MKVLMGETSPVGVQAAGIPAPLAFLRGVLCLNSTTSPSGTARSCPPTATRSTPTRSRPGPFWQGPAVGRQDDVTIGTLGRLVTALDRPPRSARSAPTCRST